MYIERISISTDIVLYWDWLSRTSVNIVLDKGEYSLKLSKCMHTIIKVLLYSGIKKSSNVEIKTYKDYDKDGTNSIFTSFDFKEIDQEKVAEYLIAGCSWVLTTEIKFNDDLKDDEKCYLDNKDLINLFFNELSDKIKNKNYKSYFQTVDGMD